MAPFWFGAWNRRTDHVINMLVKRDESFLLIVDVQEKLAPAVDGADRVVANIVFLAKAASCLGVPILITEHCPNRIGHTLPDILHASGNAKVVDKVHFCAQSESVFTAALRRLDRGKPIICGMEAHVCVLQTALGLKEAGYDPFVSTDAMASRSTGDYATALERFRQNGIEAVTCEMVVFEWLRRADTSEFRDLLALIKKRPASP